MIPSIEPNPQSLVTPSPTPELTPTLIPARTTSKITLGAVGDVLLHQSIYSEAKKETGYDFDHIFEQVKPYLQKPDLTFANSESLIAGEAYGISSYPRFNSPIELGHTLQAVGVDIVTMANNHMLDKGEAGLIAAMSNWKTIGIERVGAYESVEDRSRVRVLSANGIKVAFVGYTYGMNGLQLPVDKSFMLGTLDKEIMKAEIQQAQKEADAVVVSLHFGNEYDILPNDFQKEWAKYAVDQGADIILGHHTHVLQPVEWMTREDGSRAFVIYSLGNFLAAQELNEPRRYIGGILNVDIELVKEGDKKTLQVTNPTFLPTYVDHRKWRKYEIQLLSKVTEESLPNSKMWLSKLRVEMTRWMPELKIVEE
ncbi:CapA family protein [Paenibacillus sp. N1-5-1-14]|uniref:CapA family protein n=1 Tax=Paenibacillus radicibacter TaxID=2972488 RepID=UPI0021595474|nr:CapA family protein [Paenibacillus radicibacter]MCR8641728.1 CapA family protein [Paenibacillus radicibacter]